MADNSPKPSLAQIAKDSINKPVVFPPTYDRSAVYRDVVDESLPGGEIGKTKTDPQPKPFKLG